MDVGADAVTYSISRDGKELIAPSPLSLTLADGRVLGRKASVRKASAKSVDEIIEAPFYKRSAVEDRYNSLTLTFKGITASTSGPMTTARPTGSAPR